MDNPYWEAVKDRAAPGEFPWDEGCLQVERFNLHTCSWQDGEVLDREAFVRRYAWSITDPESIEFVAQYSRPYGLVDPIAGTGYWSYVLGQVGVDVVSYDLQPADNVWHKGAVLWVAVEAMDGAASVRKYPGRVLFMSWPPYSLDVGHRILNAYEGPRVILIGEGAGGCTGDGQLHDLLDRDWCEVDERVPVQWWGVHDRITVYERG